MACDTCYRRKVRCDLDNGPPCVACIRNGVHCSFTLAEQHKTKRRARKRSLLRSPSQARQDVLYTTPGPVAVNEPSEDAAENRANDTAQRATREDGASNSTPITEDDMAEANMAQTALTRFFHHGINKFNWEIFKEKGFIRIAYIGTHVSNLSALVSEEAYFSGTASTSLHLPFPAIRPTLSWRPTSSMPIVKWYSQSFPHDLGVLPAPDIRDDLVESFFRKVHPGFPIVDESEFRKHYRDPDNPPPLLLLQAILLVGAHVSMHKSIQQARSLVKMVIFRRAKALFDIHHENDRMHAAQAALLFTWHFDGADDICSNVYYWTGVACRIAFGLGMHRDLGAAAATIMPIDDRRIYRRIWWTIFQIEVLSSLHYGRPSMIDLDEIDQSPLTKDDFVEQDGSFNQNINTEYCIHNMELCRIIVSITKLSNPGAMRRYSTTPELFQSVLDNLDRELASWYFSLPSTLVGAELSSQRFWALQLQMHHDLALLHMHRLPSRHFPRADSVREHASQEICMSAATAVSKILTAISSDACTEQCWFTMLTALSAAAIQFSHEARTAAQNDAVALAIQAQRRLEHLLAPAAVLAKYWPGAEAVSRLYRDMLTQFKKQSKSLLTEHQRQTRHSDEREPQSEEAARNGELSEAIDGFDSIGVFDAEWHKLFGAGSPLSLPEFDDRTMQDWLNPETVSDINACNSH